MELEYYDLPADPEERAKKEKEIELLCEMTHDTKLYQKLYGSEIIAKIISHDFVYEQLIPFLVKLRNQDIETTKKEKLIYQYFVTHQENLGPLFKVLTDKKTVLKS